MSCAWLVAPVWPRYFAGTCCHHVGSEPRICFAFVWRRLIGRGTVAMGLVSEYVSLPSLSWLSRF